MNSLSRLTAFVSISLLVVACATKPAPAPTTTAAAAPDPAVKRVYLEDKTLTNEEVNALFSQGYKPTSRNGEVYYCRKEAQVGTRFEHVSCHTADQMKEIAREAMDMAASQQKVSGTPTGH
jgi:hypothetical protein